MSTKVFKASSLGTNYILIFINIYGFSSAGPGVVAFLYEGRVEGGVSVDEVVHGSVEVVLVVLEDFPINVRDLGLLHPLFRKAHFHQVLHLRRVWLHVPPPLLLKSRHHLPSSSSSLLRQRVIVRTRVAAVRGLTGCTLILQNLNQ